MQLLKRRHPLCQIRGLSLYYLAATYNSKGEGTHTLCVRLEASLSLSLSLSLIQLLYTSRQKQSWPWERCVLWLGCIPMIWLPCWWPYSGPSWRWWHIYLCMHLCLHFDAWIYVSLNIPIAVHTYVYIHMYINTYIYLSVYLSPSLSIHIYTHLYISPSLCLLYLSLLLSLSHIYDVCAMLPSQKQCKKRLPDLCGCLCVPAFKMYNVMSLSTIE